MRKPAGRPRAGPRFAGLVTRRWLISDLAPAASGVIGMSLGGLTLIRLAATRPDLVSRAVIVDVTPGSTAARAQMTRSERGTTQLIAEHRSFASLEEMAELAVHASPRRPASAVRRGVRHARPLAPRKKLARYRTGHIGGAPGQLQSCQHAVIRPQPCCPCVAQVPDGRRRATERFR